MTGLKSKLCGLLLLSFLCMPQLSGQILNLEADKRLHMWAGGGVALYTGAISFGVSGGKWQWFAYGGLIGYTGVAIGKEILDSQESNNFFDWKDVGAGYILAIPVAVAGAYISKALTKRNDNGYIVGRRKRHYAKTKKKLGL